MASVNLLYNRLVWITSDYLGPTADSFISHQIKNHLNKSPQNLVPGDITELAEWLKVSMAFLTKDTSTINNYFEALKKLARET
ncbi:MAG TPA: hypothetical protein VMR34_05475 [Candidatus Saccharimonadales bacterium]|nr:hypothetical protein [Candidatus Saccharimonadales bacterium]